MIDPNSLVTVLDPTDGKRLCVGCGDSPQPGMVNLDMDPRNERADIKMEFTEYAKSIDYAEIYSQILMSHVLEHIARPKTTWFLECARRILIPDGKLVVIVPDFDYIAECWTRYTDIWKYIDVHQRIYGLQTHEGEFHRSAWNEYHLGTMLRTVGFRNIETAFAWDHTQKTVVGWGTK